MKIKITHDKAAVVDSDYKWIDAKKSIPPTGSKLLCINKNLGVVVIGTWQPRFCFTHWAPLPTFEKDEK